MEFTIAILLTLLNLITPTLGAEPNTTAISDKLSLDFYKTTCPDVQKIIEYTIKKHAADNPGIIPGIIRLHFHDCFITGCDASILLTPQRYNSFNTEMAHPANSISLRGLHAIDAVKAEIEKRCPNVVSCADILAYAARDVIVLTAHPRYEIPAGRRDSFNTDGNLADGLLKGNDTVDTQMDAFLARGLTVEDLVVLEAAHSIGRTRCLSTIADIGTMDEQSETYKVLDKGFQKMVKEKFCPENQLENFWNMTAPLTPDNPNNTAWGITYFEDVEKGRALLPSDVSLMTNAITKQLVEQFAKDKMAWSNKFNEAMIKLGKVNVKTGNEGEIRKTCGWINAVNIV